MAPAAPPRLSPLAVTMGDPAGIGPDIILASWAQRTTRAVSPFVVFGAPEVLTQRARQLGLIVPIVKITRALEAVDVFAAGLPVMAIDVAESVMAGKPSPVNAGAVIAAIEAAVASVVSGQTSAVVTAPIAKSVLYQSGFEHPGHTEFLGVLAERLVPGRSARPVMMLASDDLRVVPLTIHVPLSAVPAAITRPLIFETVRTTWRSLVDDFGITSPRLAVAGLNPHAGEAGALGREDIEIIAPAIEELRTEGLAVTGPHSADTLFHAAARKTYDAVVCMYHDQALIPIKTLAFDSGVNVTLGLPFVRTSPDHGTAFDIAGSGRANPESFIASLKLAASIAARRAARASAGAL